MNRPESKSLLDQTIALWQPRCAHALDREDAREIIENTVGFFRVLQEWDAARCGPSSRSTRGRVGEARRVVVPPTSRGRSGVVGK